MKKFYSLIAVSGLLLSACASNEKPANDKNVVKSAVSAIDEFNEFSSENAIYFGFDSSKVDKRYNNVVKEYVSKINKLDKGVTIVTNGYCDNRGNDAYNNALGMRRAVAVKALLDKNGVNKKVKIDTVSYGKSKFKNYVDNEEENYKMNRKVEVVASK